MIAVAVCAGKGSPGATFVAVNLARALTSAGSSTLLVDLDPHGGDLAAFLGLDPRKGIYPLRLLSGGYSPEGLTGEIDVRASISCINGFPRLGDALPETVAEILTAATSTGQLVVADLGRVLPGFAEVAARASLVIVVTRPDIVSVHGAERAIDALKSSGVNQSNIGVVVNSWSWRQAAELAEIGDALRTQVLGMIPNNPRAVRTALRNQTPVTTRKITKAFDGLAVEIQPRIFAAPELVMVP